MPPLIPAASRTLAVFEVFAREKRELSNSGRRSFTPQELTTPIKRMLQGCARLRRRHESLRDAMLIGEL